MDKIRALVIDDSAIMRSLVSKFLNQNDKIEVVGTAINGRFGFSKLNRLKPDIIVLDLEMPDMNGIDFLKKAEDIGLKTPIIILSALAKRGAKITIDALSHGAADFILKPSDSNTNFEEIEKNLIEMVLALAIPNSYSHAKIITDFHKLTPFGVLQSPKIDIKPHLQKIPSIPKIDIVSIGISTGGPNALRKLLPQFSSDFPAPIVIVQHMPPGFTFEFAKSLNEICSLEVKEAEDNDILKAGRIYISPGGYQVRFEQKALATVIKITDDAPVNGHRPSAGVLFESTAKVFGRHSLACIMTGMGKDGSREIGLIRDAGGVTIAQDQESSVVFGMPKVAILNDNIQIVKPDSEIASTIKNIVLHSTV